MPKTKAKKEEPKVGIPSPVIEERESNMRDLGSWVHSHMKGKTQQGFNVSQYTIEQKVKGMSELSARGYSCELSSNQNHLEVTS